VPSAAHHRRRLALQGGSGARAARAERGHDAGGDAGEDGEDDREETYAYVGRGRQGLRRLVVRERPDERLPHPVGQQETQEAARERKDHGLHEVLADQAEPPRAERDPHRDLLLARGGAGEEEARDVRAGDQEDEADHAHEHDERGARLVAQPGGAAPARHQLERLLEEARLVGPRHALGVGRVFLEELAVDEVGRRGGLLRRDAVGEAGHADEPAGAPVAEPQSPGGLHLPLHREGDVDVDRAGHLDAVEGGRGHADDGHGVVVDGDEPAHDPGVAAEATLEEGVPQDDDRVAGGDAVVVGGEEPAQGGAEAEDLEERARDDVAVHVVGLPPDREVEGRGIVGEDTREDGAAVTEPQVHRVGDRRHGVALAGGPAHEGVRRGARVRMRTEASRDRDASVRGRATA
jgi:hypothetical protein